MKKLALTLACLTHVLNAEVATPVEQPKEIVEVDTVTKDRFFYFRFSGAESDLSTPKTPVPGLGLGYRQRAGEGAVDLSIQGIGTSESRSDSYYFALPKATYISYAKPNGETTPYYGIGLAWGILHQKNRVKGTEAGFTGIVPSVAVGYEFARMEKALGFTELEISQPALPVRYEGEFPGPSMSLSVGLGF